MQPPAFCSFWALVTEARSVATHARIQLQFGGMTALANVACPPCSCMYRIYILCGTPGSSTIPCQQGASTPTCQSASAIAAVSCTELLSVMLTSTPLKSYSKIVRRDALAAGPSRGSPHWATTGRRARDLTVCFAGSAESMFRFPGSQAGFSGSASAADPVPNGRPQLS